MKTLLLLCLVAIAAADIKVSRTVSNVKSGFDGAFAFFNINGAEFRAQLSYQVIR